jgi:hypothetical protein
LALTSLTSGGRSVGIVRSRTKAPEFVCFVVYLTTLSVSRLCSVNGRMINVRAAISEMGTGSGKREDSEKIFPSATLSITDFSRT